MKPMDQVCQTLCIKHYKLARSIKVHAKSALQFKPFSLKRSNSSICSFSSACYVGAAAPSTARVCDL